MLESTFIHVPGIGAKTEKRFWAEGFTTWDRFRQEYQGSRRPAVLPFLNREDLLYRLPKNEQWRLYPAYRDSTAFLDIETTGYSDEVTCVGIYDGCTARTFVQGRNLGEFPDAISRYELLVTFNGTGFDLPILARRFPGLDLAGRLHVDLRHALRRLGLRGGLKKIETQLGMDRGGLAGVDGWSAVHLWRMHCRGHRSALETLECYNLEDVLNLEPLLCHLYNEEITRSALGAPLLEPKPRPRIEQEADPELVDWLLGQALENRFQT